YIADTDETETYGEVLTRSIRTALKLREMGIDKNDIISTCTHNHKNSVVPIIASFFVGTKIANFDPNLSHLDTIHLLKLIEPKIIFVSLELLPFMEKCLKASQVNTDLVVFGDSETYSQFSEYLEPNPNEKNFEPVTIDDNKETAVILFSSGTTGLPKGICLSHYGLLGQTIGDDGMLVGENGEDSVALFFTTYYWISGLLFLIKCVISGSARVRFLILLYWFQVTATFMMPHQAVEFLAHRKDVNTSNLKYFVNGGSTVTKKLVDDLNEALPHSVIINGYGLTEMTGVITTFNPGIPEDVEMQIRKPHSCGKMNPRFVWKVVDPSTEETLGPNQRGELRVKGDLLMNGYYKLDSSSAFDAEGYLKTGDIVCYDEEECFYVFDRLKEILRFKGWRILPAVVEGVLMTHPAVKEAVVIGIPHELDGEHPMGIVVLHDGYDDVTPKDIEQYVEEKVSDMQRLRAGLKITYSDVQPSTSRATGLVGRSKKSFEESSEKTKKGKFIICYNQQTTCYLHIKGRIFVCFFPIKIHPIDDQIHSWQNLRASSTRFCRPTKIFLSKESSEMTRTETKLIQDQIDNLRPKKMSMGDSEITISHQMLLTMVDGKVCNSLTEISFVRPATFMELHLEE
ncbi:hypothetical protein NQ314_002607, partial [Rhamnusium bicolor]